MIAEHMRRLADSAVCCLFDLSEATTTWGPATNRALGEMLAAWESAAKPIYILPGDEAIQRLMLRELQRGSAPHFGKVVASLESVGQLLGKRSPRRG